jgi:nicotinamide-nucleotide amidase
MVCFAWALRDAHTQVSTRHFAGDRGAIRRAAVIEALNGLLAQAAML